MSLPKFTSFMLRNQPDQTAYLLNKLVEGHGGGSGDGKLYNTTGQHTDGAMTQKATTDALGTKANAVDVGNALAGKVDKEVGKGLSSNDFTDADEAKLDGIEAGAEVNVQADWDQTDTDADDYIKNKPTIPGPYTLPPATISTLGGVIVGNNLSVDSDGVLSANAGTLPSNLVYHDDPGSVTPVTPYVSFADLIWAGIFDKIYPVGSIFMSATLSTPADVATALGGGTWVAWGSGRVPVGVDTNDADFDTSEETGGIKETRHAFYRPPINNGNFQDGGNNYLDSMTNDINSWLNGGGSSSLTSSIVVRSLGGTIGSSSTQLTEVGHFRYTAPNLQPYITCYMYKRTA